MIKVTRPLEKPRPLLRMDRATGTLRERHYRVTIESGPQAGTSIALEGLLIIGTQEGVGLTLFDDTVSRHHLELCARPEGVRVRDLQSTNGTFVRGLQVQEVSLDLEREVTVRVGKTELRLHVEEQEVATLAGQRRFGLAIGESPAMQQLFAVLSKVANTDASVLLNGETGTGKDLLARSLHADSSRANGPLVVLDCGAIAENLIESELFGHVRGAFTGATADRDGAFLQADGGTLFLDEIGDLPLEMQPKLLRALDSQVVRRVGDSLSKAVDVRVVSATHRDLEAEVKAGRFREDLYYRLAVVTVKVPSLRERRSDIPLLIAAFSEELEQEPVALSPLLLARLEAYDWPGNLRELRNVVQRVMLGAEVDLMVTSGGVRVNDPGLQSMSFKEGKEKIFEAFTREYLQQLVKRFDGNLTHIAKAAGMSRAHLHRLINRYDLKLDVSE